jgi:monofunctional biosynthetic peptidoglycan transglycosylase
MFDTRRAAYHNPPAAPAPRRGWLGRMLCRLTLGFLLATVLPVLALRSLPPPASSFMLIAWATAWQAGDAQFHLDYRWTDWNEIATPAKLAVIAAEDQLFFQHSGFDLRAIERAWRHNREGGRVHGASTLSQQTAKNLFLYPGRSWARKGLEAYFTVLIEAFWTKQRILEVYLNIAQFGEGLYGVGEASRRYFGKDPAQLRPPEAALLAAILPNPALLKAERPSAYVKRRQQWILRQMRQLGDPGLGA